MAPRGFGDCCCLDQRWCQWCDWLLRARTAGTRMAGKLKAAECTALLAEFVAVNDALGSLLEKLNDSQKVVKKSIQCQELLNQSIEPIVTAFKPQEAVRYAAINPVE